MIDSQEEPSHAVTSQVQATWAGGESVRPVHASEALLHYVGGQIYLSFGQVVVPPVPGSLDGVHIEPVSQVVMSEATFHKIAGMLARALPQIPDTSSLASAETK